MSVQIRRRREAASFLQTYVGAQGELIVDTSNNRVQVHDGVTPGGWPAAKLADVLGRTPVADASYAALASDRTVAFTALTAARTVTLPAAAAFPTGVQLLVVDESGQCSATKAITVARAGSDTINGATGAVLTLAYGYLALESDGAAKWTIVDQSTASMAQQAASAVAITGGTISGAAGSFTTVATSTGPLQVATTTYATTGGTINKLQVFSGYGIGLSGGSLDYITGGIHSFYVNATKVGQVDSAGINAMALGATTPSTVKGTTLAATTSVNLPSYTVATLPAAGTAGRVVFCSNARMQTSTAGTIEAAGAGTGGLVTDNGSAWKIAGTNITASA